MGYPTKLLADGETIAFEMRPHWRSLIGPIFWLLLVVFAGGFLLNWAINWDSSLSSWLRWAVLLVGLVLISRLFIWPLITWATTEYVFTNRRILIRTGVWAKKGQDMQLSKLNNVNFSNTVIERILNAGTITISSGNDDDLIISNVPNVEVVQREINRLHEEDDAMRRGQYPAYPQPGYAPQPYPQQQQPGYPQQQQPGYPQQQQPGYPQQPGYGDGTNPTQVFPAQPQQGAPGTSDTQHIPGGFPTAAPQGNPVDPREFPPPTAPPAGQ